MDWIGWMDGYLILLWHQEHRSRAMLIKINSRGGVLFQFWRTILDPPALKGSAKVVDPKSQRLSSWHKKTKGVELRNPIRKGWCCVVSVIGRRPRTRRAAGGAAAPARTSRPPSQSAADRRTTHNRCSHVRHPPTAPLCVTPAFRAQPFLGSLHCFSPDKMYRQDKVKYKPRDSN